MVVPKIESYCPLTSQEMLEFDLTFKEFCDDAMGLNDSSSPSMDLMREWILKCVKYNLNSNEDNFRRYLVPMAYKTFVGSTTEGNMRQAYLLGWIVEIFHAAGFIAEDLVDGNRLRNGKPSWDNLDETGTLAVNDCLMLRLASLRLLTKYFGETPYYPELYKHLRDALNKFIMGRVAGEETIRRRNGSIQETLGMKRYTDIVDCKITSNILLLPIQLAISMAQLECSPTVEKKVKEVISKMGLYLQIKEDFEQVFTPQEHSEQMLLDTIRSDYSGGEWSYLLVSAAVSTSEEKFEKLRKNYRNINGDNKLSLKEDLEKIGLRQEYKECREVLYGSILAHLDDLPNGEIKQFLSNLIGRIIKQDA